ncbi:MAG TPA: hypothetical protein VKZ18_28840 [Polyangia bacterium]|nr:hypothetical protein [Polyangia bacterium]
MSTSDGSARAVPRGLRPFRPGQSGNPGGRSKAIAEVEKLALKRSPQAIEELMRIAKGRGLAAVRAAETVLAYGVGRPQHQVAITAKGGGPMNGAFVGAARAMLEAAIEQAEAASTVTQTVALDAPLPENPKAGAVIDVTAEPVASERGSAVAASTEKGTP